MNTTRIVAALALSFAASGAALAAGEASYELPQPAASTLSRATVQAKAIEARAAGTIVAGEAGAQRDTPFVAQRSRDEVRAEARAAVASGKALHGETNAFAVVAQVTAPQTVVASR